MDLACGLKQKDNWVPLLIEEMRQKAASKRVVSTRQKGCWKRISVGGVTVSSGQKFQAATPERELAGICFPVGKVAVKELPIRGTLDSYIPSARGESPELIRAIGKHYVPDKYFKCAHAKVGFVPMRKENIATEGSMRCTGDLARRTVDRHFA